MQPLASLGKVFADLDDYDRTRWLNDSLQDYLAAETALPDAKGERVARLQLLQANALLFGFDKPGEAAALYAAAGVDTAADSTVAARALRSLRSSPRRRAVCWARSSGGLPRW